MLHTSWDNVEREPLNARLERRMLSGERATIARVFLRKGCVVPRHSHESEQFSWTFSGALKFIFDDGREVVVRPGEILYIPGGVPHAAEALEDTDEADFFSPRRDDWIQKDDAYLRK
jgi:quercetin dioxygenase-like cupin family protein